MTEKEKEIVQYWLAIDAYCESHKGCQGCILEGEHGCAINDVEAREKLREMLSQWRRDKCSS